MSYFSNSLSIHCSMAVIRDILVILFVDLICRVTAHHYVDMIHYWMVYYYFHISYDRLYFVTAILHTRRDQLFYIFVVQIFCVHTYAIKFTNMKTLVSLCVHGIKIRVFLLTASFIWWHKHSWFSWCYARPCSSSRLS